MDFRGTPFGGDGNLEIVLAVAAVWLAVFVFMRARQAVTGKAGDAGAVTFSIVIYAVFGFFLLAATFIAAWFISGMALLALSMVTATPFDRVAMSSVFQVVWLLVGLAALYWLGRAR